MIKKQVVAALLAAVMLAFGCVNANAGTSIFSTPDGAVEQSGLPVDASVSFTIETGKVSLTINNMQANPRSVAQNISDLFFTIGDASGAIRDFTSYANLVNIDKDGVPSSVGTHVSTGWGLEQSSDFVDFQLNDIGFAGPKNTILGAPDEFGDYTNANSSIAGKKPHNPFIDQSATFRFFSDGVTENSVVSNVVFSFGSEPGNNVGVPEPASLICLGMGLVGMAGLRRVFQKGRPA